jgi:hypothetical protein
MSVVAPADDQVVRFTTFLWDGNSCFFDTWLEQNFWLRERLGCTPPDSLFIPVRTIWAASLQMMDQIHSLQHKAESRQQCNETRDTLMDTRTRLRNQLCRSNDLKGEGLAMGDVLDLWSAIRSPENCSPAHPEMFGARRKSRPCMGCFHSATPQTKSHRTWTTMRMDDMTVLDAVALGLSTEESYCAYYGVDLWKSLQGYPTAPWSAAVKCKQCPNAYAYPMQIEGPRQVLMCIIERGEVGKPNATKVHFREWESIIVGNELVSYKAIADGRLESLHWTCVVDVNLASHSAHGLKGTWHLMDDLKSKDGPAALLDAGWTDYEEFRTMVIYVRIDSRALTGVELELEGVRLADMAQRVERLRSENTKKGKKQQPIKFDSS